MDAKRRGRKTMRALAPWTGMDGFKREMDRLFDRFFEPRWPELEVAGEWAPKVDVAETKDAVVVSAELPGMEQKDIGVELEGEKLHRLERSWGAFRRTFRLPSAVEGGKVAATFKNGLLTVTLPKAPGAKGTAIPVKAERK